MQSIISHKLNSKEPGFGNEVKEHQQKTFFMLSGFWLLRGFGLSESVKKKIHDGNLFFR